MIEIRRNADKAIIVAHEIYGLNSHILYMCKFLGEQGYDVYAPNLLNRQEPFDYAEEQEAYRSFMENVGFDQASSAINKLVTQLKSSYQKVFLVGFSVGATASWLNSSNVDADGMVGYYGSRIRGYIDVVPVCPVLLFYPETESSFDVDKLMVELKDKPYVEVHKLHGQHGFSDPYSSRYLEASAEAAFRQMIIFLKSIG